MAWTTPHVFAVGEVLTSANMALIENNIQFIHDEMDYEIAYAESSSLFLINASNTDLITLPSITFNGSTRVSFEFFVPHFENGGSTVTFRLYDGTTPGNDIAVRPTGQGPVYGTQFSTPSAGAHTFKVVGFCSFFVNNATVEGGTGATGAMAPMYLRLKVAP